MYSINHFNKQTVVLLLFHQLMPMFIIVTKHINFCVVVITTYAYCDLFYCCCVLKKCWCQFPEVSDIIRPKHVRAM